MNIYEDSVSDIPVDNIRQTIEEVQTAKETLVPGEPGPGLKADAGKRDLVLFPWETLRYMDFELTHQDLAEYLSTESLNAAYVYIFEEERTSIDGMTQVMEFGLEKYVANNWQNVRPGIRYISGALRHLMAIEAGEELDPESGLRHWDHLGCCVIFAKWQQDRGINLWEKPDVR